MQVAPQAFIDHFSKLQIKPQSAKIYWNSLQEEVQEDFLLWFYQQPFATNSVREDIEQVLSNIVAEGKAEKDILHYIKPLISQEDYDICIDKQAFIFLLKLRTLYDDISNQANKLQK